MPRLIHMMYFPWGPDQQLCSDTEVFERGPYENMKQYAPDFSVSLWTYARISEFGRLYYPAMWEAVCALPRPVMMVDILRWLVVYHFGGIFWQYHMAPLAPMERVLPAQGKSVKVFTEFVNDPEFCRKMAAEPIRQGEPEEPLRIATQAFSAEPRHPFVKKVLDFILHRAGTLTPRRDYDILYICGNAAVSTAYDRFGVQDAGVELAPRDETLKMMKLRYRGTWRAAGKAALKPAAPISGAGTERRRTMDGMHVRLAFRPPLQRFFYRYVRTHPHEAVFAEHRPADKLSPRARKELADLPAEWGLHTTVEYPCGSIPLGRAAAWRGVRQIGGHPSRSLLKQDREGGWVGDGCIRVWMNALFPAIPAADMIICRDYFPYLDFREISLFIRHLRGGTVRYLLATTHPLLHENWDTALGDWRPVNLERAPFNWPVPLKLIADPEPGRRPDRSLALWEVRYLP